ncbi:MAG: FHA domain-containing protein [Anaerolineales bacterium]
MEKKIVCVRCGQEIQISQNACPACGALIERLASQDVDVFAATQAEINVGPIKPPCAFLTLMSGEHAGQQYKLSKKQVIGRDNVEIIIRDPRMSRSHASVEVFGTEYLLRDLSSVNHTYINNEMIQQPTIMKHGDKIRVGNTEFEFIIKEK